MCPAHLHLLNLMVLKMSWTWVCSLTHLFVFLSLYVTPSIFFPCCDELGLFFSFPICLSMPRSQLHYVMVGNTHWLNTFLFRLTGISPLMILLSVPYWHLSNSTLYLLFLTLFLQAKSLSQINVFINFINCVAIQSQISGVLKNLYPQYHKITAILRGPKKITKTAKMSLVIYLWWRMSTT